MPLRARKAPNIPGNPEGHTHAQGCALVQERPGKALTCLSPLADLETLQKQEVKAKLGILVNWLNVEGIP